MIMKYKTKRDVNGNSRALWVIFASHRINDEGILTFYPKAKPKVYRDFYGASNEVRDLINMYQITPIEVDITPGTYRAILSNKQNEWEIMVCG